MDKGEKVICALQKEDSEIVIDYLSERISELKKRLIIIESENKNFEEQLKNYKQETKKMEDLESKNTLGFIKENKILKEKIKELEEKIKTKEKIKRVMKELDKSKEL